MERPTDGFVRPSDTFVNIYREYWRYNMLTRCKHLLGITDLSKVTFKSLKNLYKKASLKAHPDKGGSEEEFQEVMFAYEYVWELLERMFGGRNGDMWDLEDDELMNNIRKGRDADDAVRIARELDESEEVDRREQARKFNEFFEKSHTLDVNDRHGYNEWLKGRADKYTAGPSPIVATDDTRLDLKEFEERLEKMKTDLQMELSGNFREEYLPGGDDAVGSRVFNQEEFNKRFEEEHRKKYLETSEEERKKTALIVCDVNTTLIKAADITGRIIEDFSVLDNELMGVDLQRGFSEFSPFGDIMDELVEAKKKEDPIISCENVDAILDAEQERREKELADALTDNETDISGNDVRGSGGAAASDDKKQFFSDETEFFKIIQAEREKNKKKKAEVLTITADVVVADVAESAEGAEVPSVELAADSANEIHVVNDVAEIATDMAADISDTVFAPVPIITKSDGGIGGECGIM
jgi:curved DNA-binding protein CbpA